MPLIFPSHQGLILPLWAKYPQRIDCLALCVGAAMPDVVDFIAWPLRGSLGQWLGHSLLGLLLCVVAGLPLCWIARKIGKTKDNVTAACPHRKCLLSLLIGAASHLLSDFVTHGNFWLLFPWYGNLRVFPDWWYHEWGKIPIPVYEEAYPLAPHTLAWVLASGLGIVLFFRTLRRAGGD